MIHQKKKSPPHKKLKAVKSESVLPPFGSLMQDISELKKELKGIKQSKKDSKIIKNKESDIENSIINTFNYDGIKKNKTQKENIDGYTKEVQNQTFKNRKANQCIEFPQVYYPSKEQKLKLEIQINKLRRYIINGDLEIIGKQTHEVLSIADGLNRQSFQQMKQLRKDQIIVDKTYQGQRRQMHEKYKNMQKTNKRLQEEVQRLKNHLLTAIDEQESTVKLLLDKSKDKQIDHMSLELNELLQQNRTLSNIIEELQTRCNNLDEKSRFYEQAIAKKEDQIIFFEEDVNYLRIQADKYKDQKKDIEKITEKLSQQIKDMKRKYELELQQLGRQKNKWQNQCSLRRFNSEEVQQIEAQKNILLKEVQQLRSSFNLKCSEYNEIKSMLHENHKSVINVESENYKLQTQNEQLQRNKEYCEYELAKLNEELEELRKMKAQKCSEYKTEVKKIKVQKDQQKKVKEEKLRALDDIHSLIRKHKEQIDAFE